MQESDIGTQIGKFLIEAKLGEGGMGSVYRAIETTLDRVVAIKALHPELARDPAIADRFRAEARAQANLNHPNVTILYSFDVEQDNAMMVMEYVDGETFSEMLRRRGPIPAEEVVPLFKQALKGLGAAHRQGITHRDIKPGNLMLNKTGTVKVMDFGIAKIAGNRNLTRTGINLGTLLYMSPEQVKGAPVDAKSDIYSLGVTMYQMLTGQAPFKGDSDYEILNKHVNTPPPLLTSFRPDVPKHVEEAVLRALAKEPADRFASVEEFSNALGPDKPAEEPVLVYQPFAPPPSKLPWIVAGIAVACALVALALLFLPRGGQNPQKVVAGQTTPATVAKTSTTPPPSASVTATKEPVATATTALTATKPLGTKKLTTTTSTATMATAENTSTTAGASTTTVTVPTTAATATPEPIVHEVTLPVGAHVHVRLPSNLAHLQLQAGQFLAGTVDAPTTVSGEEAVLPGTLAEVRVVDISKSGFVHRSSKVDIELVSLVIAGKPYRIHAQPNEIQITGDKIFGKIAVGSQKDTADASHTDLRTVFVVDSPATLPPQTGHTGHGLATSETHPIPPK